MTQYYLTPDDVRKAKENGVTERLLRSRVYEKGWPVNRAITQKTKHKTKDAEFKKWSDIAATNGIKRSLFWQRVHVSKWTYGKAATHPIMTSAEVIKKANETVYYKVASPGQYAVALKNGVKPKTLRNRIYLGWTLDEAINTPLFTQDEVLDNARSNSMFGRAWHL